MKLGKYKHFKGMEVQVLYIAKHSETLEDFVIYSHKDPVKGEKENSVWIRPKSMFLEQVVSPEYKYRGPRFIFVGRKMIFNKNRKSLK